MNALGSDAALRGLVFAAEAGLAEAASAGPDAPGGPEGPLASAQTALLHLHSLLSVTAGSAPAARHQADALLQQCTNQLHRLSAQEHRSAPRRERVQQLLRQAGCPEGFRFTTPEGFDLAARLRQSEPHASLLNAPLPSRRVALTAPPAPGGGAPAPAPLPGGRPAPPGVLAEQQGNQAAPAPRRSGFQVPTKPDHPGAAFSAGGSGPASGYDAYRRQQPQHPQHPPPQHPPPQQQHPQHPHPGAAQGDSRWASNKLPRLGQDAHVHQSRQARGHSGDEEEGGGRGRVRRGSGSGSESGGEAEEAGGRSIPGFQTAKAKLITDMRAKGQQYQPGPGGGSQGGPGGPPRPGLRGPGLRKTGGGGGGLGGAAGKFVPPYLRKALEAQNGGGGGEGEAEGPLSARTLEILRLSPGEALPDALAKLDPLLIENVCSEVMDSGGQLDWDDIAGQQLAKNLIQEVVVWPMKNPQLFTGARAPPKGILLFGPPGTGKTMLGKAIATNISAVFFSISASSLVSKWMGEGEKLVRALFAVAAHVAPSVIFIDEVDSLLSARKADGEHESMRRLKTEILIQMEGIDPSRAERRVLLIGATNRPEELDEAARRRMPKQLYIPLPDADARRDLVQRALGPHGLKAALSAADLAKIVARTEGYSGSDMKMFIQEASQGAVRDAIAARVASGQSIENIPEEEVRPVILKDFQNAAKVQKASVELPEIERYERYNEKHGARVMAAAEEDEEEDW